VLEAALRPQGQALAKLFSYGYDGAGNRPLEQIETLGGSPVLKVTGSDFNSAKQPAGEGGIAARAGEGRQFSRFLQSMSRGQFVSPVCLAVMLVL
jgi:hypothetical protein